MDFVEFQLGHLEESQDFALCFKAIRENHFILFVKVAFYEQECLICVPSCKRVCSNILYQFS